MTIFKISIIVLLTITCSLKLNGQSKNEEILIGRIKSDTCGLSNNNLTGLTSILDSQNPIEIRFTTYTYLSSKNYTIVLTYNSYNHWNAIEYNIDNNRRKMNIVHVIYPISIDSLFSILVQNNVFYLPDDTVIGKEKIVFNPKENNITTISSITSDGYGYQIEFKVDKKYRRYSFYNSDDYYKEYPYITELMNYTNIINAFDLFKEQ